MSRDQHLQSGEPSRRRPAEFGEAPESKAAPAAAGGRLLAFDLQRSYGNAFVQMLARSGSGALLRAAAHPRAPRRPGPLVARKGRGGGGGTPKTKAIRKLGARWGVGTVREGTIDDQARLTARTTRGLSTAEAKQQLTEAGWKPWSPFEKHSVWTDLAASFDDIKKSFGGAPQVSQILFFDTEYVSPQSGDSGPLVANRSTHASYSSGIIEVYREVLRGRFVAGSRGGAKKAAGVRVGARFTIGHELGHGIVEAILASVDSGQLSEYGKAVGWYRGALYDVGAKGVRDSIDGDRTPDGRFVISAKNWNDGSLHEQPISQYMTTGLSEDLPEAIAAFMHYADTLKARSPARFKFVSEHRKQWTEALRAAK